MGYRFGIGFMGYRFGIGFMGLGLGWFGFDLCGFGIGFKGYLKASPLPPAPLATSRFLICNLNGFAGFERSAG